MGRSSWTDKDWSTYASTRIDEKKADDIYTARTMAAEFNPRNADVRESRDSDEHPLSTPIIIGLDVTGSMHDILETVAHKLGMLVSTIHDRSPVTDPQIMFAAIGDSDFDTCPLQVTQFESDIRIAEQLTQLYFEKGGGPNDFESYPLLWYFAARHTVIDSFTKRGKKGILFTMGDDCYPEKLTKDEIAVIFGDTVQADIPVAQIMDEVTRKYEVFHLVLDRRYDSSQIKRWRDILGQYVIKVDDPTKVTEVIVSILETLGGKSTYEVARSWDGSTALTVQNAIKDLKVSGEESGLVIF